MSAGYIYFMWSPAQNALKIGHTLRLGMRRAGLQTGNPTKLSFLEVIRGSRALEKELHKRFQPYRISGEWFREDEVFWDFLEDIEDIQLAIFKEMVVSGQFSQSGAKKRTIAWHDMDISEEQILALAPPLPVKGRKNSPSPAGSAP